MLKLILALLLAFVLAVVGTCLAAWLLAGRIPKDYKPLRPHELRREEPPTQPDTP